MVKGKALLMAIATSLVAGLGVGVLIFYLAFHLPQRRQLHDTYVFQLESSLIALELLAEGKDEEFVRRKQNQLPIFASMLRGGELRDHPGADYFMWRIRRYCETNRLPADDHFAAILKTAPTNNPYPTAMYYENGFVDGFGAKLLPQLWDKITNR